MPVIDLDAIASGNGWKTQRIQVSRLLNRARDYRRELALQQDLPWHMDGIGAHHWGSKYDLAQRIFRFIYIHRHELAQSPSLPQHTRSEALSCLDQWARSLEESGFYSA